MGDPGDEHTQPLTVEQRLEHLEHANKPAWFSMWRRYDGLDARIESLETSRRVHAAHIDELNRRLNKLEAAALETPTR